MLTIVQMGKQLPPPNRTISCAGRPSNTTFADLRLAETM